MTRHQLDSVPPTPCQPAPSPLPSESTTALRTLNPQSNLAQIDEVDELELSTPAETGVTVGTITEDPHPSSIASKLPSGSSEGEASVHANILDQHRNPGNPNPLNSLGLLFNTTPQPGSSSPVRAQPPTHMLTC